MLARFSIYRVAHPTGPITDSVRAFLASLTPSVGHTAWLALKAALPDLPWDAIAHPRAHRNEAVLQATLLTPEERVRIRAATTIRERALVECFWTLRRVEVTRVRWADVNLSDGTIGVVRKGGRAKLALLPLSAQAALAEWFTVAGEPPDHTYIFPGRFGGAMHPGSVSHVVRRVLRRAGVYRRWRGAHAFRRTLATSYLKENPGDLEGLAKILGHEAITTTMLYNWMRPEELRPRLDRVRL
jgi:integrase